MISLNLRPLGKQNHNKSQAAALKWEWNEAEMQSELSAVLGTVLLPYEWMQSSRTAATQGQGPESGRQMLEADAQWRQMVENA